MTNGFIIQRPTPPNEWLTKLEEPNNEDTRKFSDVIGRPDTTPAWDECTDDFKRKWEEEHPQPEPETE